MSAREVYPVSMFLVFYLTVVNQDFTSEAFNRFCDDIVAEAFQRTGYILNAGPGGIHSCAACNGKPAWHFTVLTRRVTFNRLSDIQALTDELRPLKEVLCTLGHGSRQAEVYPEPLLLFHPLAFPPDVEMDVLDVLSNAGFSLGLI